MKKTATAYIKPHLEGLNKEQIHYMQKGFLLGIQYTRDEIDAFIKSKEQTVN